MDIDALKLKIIEAGEKAVEQLIKVAQESILNDSEDDIAADRLKNAAATKKLAIFDALEILSRIEQERSMLDGNSRTTTTTTMSSFAERRAK